MSQIHCDFDAVLDRVGGDRELLAQLALVVLGDLDGLLDALRTALESADTAEIRARAHRLKGAIGNFEVQPVFDLALAIERAGAEQRLGDARRDWDELGQYLDEFRTFLTGVSKQQ